MTAVSRAFHAVPVNIVVLKLFILCVPMKILSDKIRLSPLQRIAVTAVGLAALTVMAAQSAPTATAAMCTPSGPITEVCPPSVAR